MTREWRNWQTRTFEGRVVHTVRVQVPFLAPRQAARLAFYFFLAGVADGSCLQLADCARFRFSCDGNPLFSFNLICGCGGMADALDSGSSEGNFVWVQVPLPAP